MEVWLSILLQQNAGLFLKPELCGDLDLIHHLGNTNFGWIEAKIVGIPEELASQSRDYSERRARLEYRTRRIQRRGQQAASRYQRQQATIGVLEENTVGRE